MLGYNIVPVIEYKGLYNIKSIYAVSLEESILITEEILISKN